MIQNKLIVCLGYKLEPDNYMHTILKNRLKDTANLCAKNKNSTLLLMGASYYKNKNKNLVSEASVMKKYLETKFPEKIKNTKILKEEKTTSTVEQICYLKKFIKKEKFEYSDLVIISSKYFSNRVKLYVEYIFSTTKDVTFIKSAVPKSLITHFKMVEVDKLKIVKDWFKNHTKGDDKKILKEQKEFQHKVEKGEINQLVS